ncbi:damage-control phosphatase ARMT1 family protein [[Eubacterium] cellulosolvens]
MKVKLDCIPCFQRQALEAARFVTNDIGVQEKILRRVITELEKMDWTGTPPEMAHTVHQIVKEECNVSDPYKDIKKQFNDIALSLYPELKEIINKSAEPLLTAVRLAIAGNVIDFGANSQFDLKETISNVLGKEFALNDYDKLLEILRKSKSLLYLADNTGEIVFDKLLLETILSKYKIDKIIFGVKGAPIINDAMLEDAEYVGINKLLGVELIKIGIGLPNTGLERNSAEFLNILNSSDIVISKGQGNYEALSKNCGIFFLLMAKCPVIADDLNVKLGEIILKKI